MVNKCIGLSLLLVWLILGGCTHAVVESTRPIEIGTSEYSRMYRAAVLVLRDHGFRLDRQDYRFGHISTRPLPAPTIIEPWDHTNSTFDQALESTINSQRRVVSVMFDPAGEQAAQVDPDPGYLMRIEAMVERVQIPARQLTGSTDGPRVFGTLSVVPRELAQRGIVGPYWQTVGRDSYLEHQLLEQIVRQSLTLPP